jgi:uncharacterized protein (TIGR02266 family)
VANTPVRIRLRYPDVDTFVQKFAPNVTRGGVFLASRNIQPVGELIAFEIQLVTGEAVLAGQGKVTWVKAFNPDEPTRPYGMGVQFVNVTPSSRPILARILRTKEANGPAPRGLTGAYATLGSGPVQAGVTPAPLNGKGPAAAVDTNVDLAAELGVDEAALQLVLDRRRRLMARTDDDLGDLLRPDPVEVPTLAYALSELPRLLDAQNSRRRAATGFRTPDSGPLATDTTSTGGSGPVAASDDTRPGDAIPAPLTTERSSGRSKRRRS